MLNFYLAFECPHCYRLFEVPALEIEVFHDGMTVVCPRCEARLEIRILETTEDETDWSFLVPAGRGEAR